MTRKRLIIYSWNVPKGGLFKVIYKEYKYFIKNFYDTSFLTSQLVPDSYSNEFNAIDGIYIGKNENTGMGRDLSTFFPGLNISISDGIIKSIGHLYTYYKFRRPSIILAHQLLSATMSLPYVLTHKAKLVLVLHDNPFMFLEAKNNIKIHFHNKVWRKLIYYLEKFTLKSCSSVICTTSHIKEKILDKVGDIDNLVVADYGIDLAPRVSENNRKFLLTVSKWSEFRNPNKYVEVLEYLPSRISLVIAGRWDSEIDLSSFNATVVKRNLQSRVSVLINLSEEELFSLYDSARVFLRLGYNEAGTGQSILEAIGHGCPVVISKGLGASEIVINGKHGFVTDATNTNEIASKILEIFDDDELFDNMSSASYQLAKAYGWNSYLEKISTIINE